MGVSISLEDIESVEYCDIETIYDITVEDNSNYIIDAGKEILVHNSSKTFDAIHFIVAFCNHNLNKGLKFYMFRKTLKDCREKLYESDFVECLKIIGIYDKNNARNEGVNPEYNLFGNKIYFRGIDSIGTEATYSDGIFYNELMDEDEYNNISGWVDRCKKFVIFDWNPKYTLHWVFDWEGRPNVYFTHTTYKNNKKLDPVTINRVEALSPWHLDDLKQPKDQRRPHEENIKNNTADEWRFEVYGMGIRANKSGLVFPNVTWIDELPSNVSKYFYGIDFGNTTGTYALAEGCHDGENLYFDVPIYGSFADKQDIAADANSGLKSFYEALKQLFKGQEKQEKYIICDSAQPHKITDLNIFAERDGCNWQFLPVKKFPGCIKWRIDVLKRYRLHFVKRKHTIAEQENYCWKQINGISFNEPIDDHNHGFDAIGYSIQYQYELIYEKK